MVALDIVIWKFLCHRLWCVWRWSFSAVIRLVFASRNCRQAGRCGNGHLRLVRFRNPGQMASQELFQYSLADNNGLYWTGEWLKVRGSKRANLAGRRYPGLVDIHNLSSNRFEMRNGILFSAKPLARSNRNTIQAALTSCSTRHIFHRGFGSVNGPLSRHDREGRLNGFFHWMYLRNLACFPDERRPTCMHL